ncbi:MAG TPA: tetratricopeptide repeat protein [Sphingobium sp.]
MRARSALFALAILSLPVSVFAADTEADRASANINKAGELILKKQPVEALALVETVLGSYEKPLVEARAKGEVYCATNTAEALLYSAISANRKTSNTVFPGTLCEALFVKAYALNELKREPEAVAALEQLTALAPRHAHYFVELGYAYRMVGAPDKAMTAYRTAFDNSTTPGLDDAKADRAAALRGIGYLLIDKNDLDGAAASYRKSLEEDPTSAIAKSELEYIDGLRKKSR